MNSPACKLRELVAHADRPALRKPRPLADMHAGEISHAQALQTALATALRLPLETSIAERARLARPQYRAAFGVKGSERHLRRLISRTIERDGGAGRWENLELYLAEQPRRREPAQHPKFCGAQFADLETALATIADRTAPTAADRAFTWRHSIEWLETRIAAGTPEADAKSELRGYLWKAAPFLARSENALRKTLDGKLRLAREVGSVAAVIDRRAEKSGNRKWERYWGHRIAEWDWNLKLFACHTTTRHGREAQAWRECHLGTTPTRERFTESFREYHPFNPRVHKSQVPKAVRRALAPTMAAIEDLTYGPRAARLRLPSIHQDWSGVEPGAWMSADDLTADFYVWEASEFGDYEFEGTRFDVFRPQILAMTDERSDFPLGFSVLPTPTYSGRDIKALCCKVWMDETIGLPGKGARFEGGSWQALAVKALFDWPKIDEAFLRAGIALSLRHRRTPKGKPIERVFGSLHHLLDHLPGWVGNDEQHRKFERVRRFLQSLKRYGQPVKAEVDPRQGLLSRAEATDELDRAIRQFSEEPKNGERHGGLSPAELWSQGVRSVRKVLPESLRYLLASDCSRQTVTHEGIRLKVGREFLHYVGSEKLGALQREKVEVYFNAEMPESVSVIHRASDPRGVNPFAVPLFKRLPAHGATAEQFAEARTHQQAFAKFGRTLFRTLTPPRNLTIRNEQLGSPELRTRGEAINRHETEAKALKSERGRHAAQIGARADRMNLSIDPQTVKSPSQTAARLDELAAIYAEFDADESSSQTPP